jgi:membrane protein
MLCMTENVWKNAWFCLSNPFRHAEHDLPMSPATRQPYLPSIDDGTGNSGTRFAHFIQRWWQVLKITIAGFQADRVTQLAAALAYFTLFSIAPLLLVVVAVAGAMFGDKAVEGHLASELRGYVGDESAALLQQMVALARRQGGGGIASLLSVGLLLYGASKVFNQLKVALNDIWNVKPRKQARLWYTIKYYLFSMGMVLSVGFVLLVSLVLHTFLSTMQGWIEGSVPAAMRAAYLWEIAASILVTGLLFALMLKYLPDTRVPWTHVWLGAYFTAILFTIGKLLFGWYLSRGTVGSTYGAAGSVIVVLLWAYYSALIFLLGAEFTRAHATVFGRGERSP